LKIIALYGAKHSKKDVVAFKLSQYSDCVWVKPYTDWEDPVNLEDYEQDDLVHMNERKLSAKMEREVPFCMTEVNGHRYVFFENQFNAGYCVMIVDDRALMYLKNNWDGDLVTVICHSKNEEYSDRSLLSDEEFDIVFDADSGDYGELEELVGDIYDFKVKA